MPTCVLWGEQFLVRVRLRDGTLTVCIRVCFRVRVSKAWGYVDCNMQFLDKRVGLENIKR